MRRGRISYSFLDIEIRNEEMKGLEVARKIRDRDPYALIVFVNDSLGVYAPVLSLPSVCFGLH